MFQFLRRLVAPCAVALLFGLAPAASRADTFNGNPLLTGSWSQSNNVNGVILNATVAYAVYTAANWTFDSTNLFTVSGGVSSAASIPTGDYIYVYHIENNNSGGANDVVDHFSFGVGPGVSVAFVGYDTNAAIGDLNSYGTINMPYDVGSQTIAGVGTNVDFNFNPTHSIPVGQSSAYLILASPSAPGFAPQLVSDFSVNVSGSGPVPAPLPSTAGMSLSLFGGLGFVGYVFRKRLKAA